METSSKIVYHSLHLQTSSFSSLRFHSSHPSLLHALHSQPFLLSIVNAFIQILEEEKTNRGLRQKGLEKYKVRG